MTEQPSPWARPPAGSEDPARGPVYPPISTEAAPGPRHPGSVATAPATSGAGATRRTSGAGRTTEASRAGGAGVTTVAGPRPSWPYGGHPTGDRPGYRAGTVTKLAPAPPSVAPAAAPPGDPTRRNR